MNPARALIEKFQGRVPVGMKRDPRWRGVRADFIDANPGCAVCDREDGVEAHHIIPFHVMPEWELEYTNLITLCRKHHLGVGHCGNWRLWNPNVDSLAVAFNQCWREARGSS